MRLVRINAKQAQPEFHLLVRTKNGKLWFLVRKNNGAVKTVRVAGVVLYGGYVVVQQELVQLGTRESSSSRRYWIQPPAHDDFLNALHLALD
jgi:hypothetical protein